MIAEWETIDVVIFGFAEHCKQFFTYLVWNFPEPFRISRRNAFIYE